MSRIYSVRENWTEVTNKLLKDKQELARFFRFSAGMYKQSFPDAALIYHQNPNATKVAELSDWNKLGRLVNKGEHSIAVFGEENKCRYLFDITQTNGKRLPELWKLTEDISSELTAVINEKYGRENKNIYETIAAMSVDNLKSYLPEMQGAIAQMKLSEKDMKAYQQSMVSAVRFMVSSRCELGNDMKISGGINLNAVDLFKNNRDLIRFCDLVQKSAKNTLLEMEREIVQILRKRREKEYGLQAQPDRTVQSRSSVHQQPTRAENAGETNRKMGQNVAGMDENRVPDRGDGSHNRVQMANRSEESGQRSGKSVSEAGRAIPRNQSPSENIQRNTGVGENAPADSRASGDERSSIPSEVLTVQALIDRYKNADFNRRLDSYEIAGHMLYEAECSEWKNSVAEYFNKFEADKYSAVQAEEIRNIIESAEKNRAPEIAEPKEPVILNNSIVDTSELPPFLDEKLIQAIVKHDDVFNVKCNEIEKFFKANEDVDKRTEYIKSAFNSDYTEFDADGVRVGYKANENGIVMWEGNYLSRTKESGFSWQLVQEFTADLIEKGEYLDKEQRIEAEKLKTADNNPAILSFSEKDGQIYAEYLLNGEKATAEIKRTEDDIPYLMVNGKPQKLTDIQSYDLEQFELFRSPITHDVNGYYAEDLDEGDRIKFKGEVWTVESKKPYSIKLVNNVGQEQIFFANWDEKLTGEGFEYIGGKEEEIAEPVFAKPIKSEENIGPVSEDEQLSLFGEPVSFTQADTKPKPQKKAELPVYAIEQEMIDYVMKCGSNKPRTLERIAVQFQKGKSSAENADFLRNEFRVDGRGYKYASADNMRASLISAWFDKDGITIGAGNTAFNSNSNVHLSWEQVSDRISELLQKGEYCSQDIIDRAAGYEIAQISEKLWYLHQDCEVEYFIPDEMFKGGFPDSTLRISASLSDKETLQKYINGLESFVKQYEENRDILRFHFHKPKELLGRLKDLQMERKDFIANPDFNFNPQYFITEDEKDKVLIGGSGFQNGKFQINDFFKQKHTAKEKIKFLVNAYGIGGNGYLGINTRHDAKGFTYLKGISISEPDCMITMKWNEVSERIERLISQDKYITQHDIDERIRNAKYELKNRQINTDYDKSVIENAKKTLEQYGVSFEDDERKSPAEKLIEKAEAEGIPVEITEEPEQEASVYMDIRDESYISVMQTDEGVAYTLYASDLTPADSGVWEMDNGMDLKSAAAELLGTSPDVLAEIYDYDKFMELADYSEEMDISRELAELKSETIKSVPDKQTTKEPAVNNPDMVLGKMAWDERMKGKYGDDSKVTACIADNTVPLSEQIKNAVSKIEGTIETVKSEDMERDESDIIPADPSVRNFTHTIVDGNLYFRENEIMTKVAETGKTLDRMMGMHKIRQAAMETIEAQANGCSDEELEGFQKRLNAVYDKFKKAYGNITDSANERCFRQDDDYNTIAALEVVDTEKKTVEKAEIFSKRTIQPVVEVTSVDTPQEALQVSIDRLGKVDIKYMSQLVGSEPEKIISDLDGEIYRNPASVKENELFSGYEDASEYLSGNVREKLRTAEEYAKHIDNSFEKNVSALEKVIPKDLEASEISVRIGANWIDVEDYNRFLHEYAKAEMGMFGHPVTRTKMGEYKIEGKYQDKSIAANETYGTSRMSSYHIFENLLNQRDIVVRDRKEVDGKVYYEVNAKETQLAKEKARQMKEAFKGWVWEDINRREKYVKKYNNLFNAIRGREYDGSHQSFYGMNPAIKLRPHQENAILRAKLNGNTLLAHCVGAGKSFEMVATAMEKKRLGLINKACVVVPKHLTLQMASEWMRLYPQAKLLVARPEDFEKNNRKKFIARCVTGDYDAVIMSFTQFERIPMSDEYRKQFMEHELNEILDALEEVDTSDRVSVKALERQKMKIEEKLEKLMSAPKDNSLCFEKLGFDYLVCDEAHNYKNCFVTTKMSNVAGVQTTAAQKSEDMLMKTQYLNEKYDCNNILFATGTPVSNSMVELYVMQRYLRPDLLKKAGLQTFDDWASTFGEVVSQLEIKPAGNGFQMKNRFSKFVNIPELMQMYKEFADIQTPDMIKLPVPKLKTGEPIVVSSKPDERQVAYMKELAARSEAIHNGNVDPSVDNMLKITHEARLLGLDSRCIFNNAEPLPDSKVMKLLDNLEQNYIETKEQKGVQIVFCDIAINEDSEHFSVYEAIKDDLVKRDIPREEICFAGDAKTDKARAEMFEQLRKGEKRFIIASTSKLGTGANVQDRICAIHHLDIPWKPSDLIQQDGRGIRQGNMFDEVGVYHYLTEETFDAYMMGIITNKAKFINQIMTSKDPVRISEDVDEMVLTYSQMQAIASGNPLIKEKIQLDNDIAMLKTLEAEHKKSAYKLQELAERKLPLMIENYADLLEKASKDLKSYQEQHPDNAEFCIEIGGRNFVERTDAGEEIEKAIIRCSTTGESINIGKYFGFDVSIEKNPANSNLFQAGTPCVAVLHGNLKYTSEVSLGNNVGNVRRIENLAGIQINQKIQQFSASLDKAKNDLEEAKLNISKPFERAEELKKMTDRLKVVNAELSVNHIDDDDEPVPVSDVPSEDKTIKPTSVVVTMPVPAVNTVPMMDKPPLPQFDKPKQTFNKMRR